MPNLPYISTDLVKTYQSEIAKSDSPATAKRRMSSLKKFFGWATENGHLPSNPIAAPPLPVSPVGQFPLSPDRKKGLRPSHVVAGFTTVALIILIFLLLGKLKLPIPFRFAPASNDTSITVKNGDAGKQTIIASAWTVFAKLGLTNQAGRPITTSQSISFKIYSAESGGQAVYTSPAQTLTPDATGTVQVSLNNVPTEVFFQNDKLYLAPVTAEGETSTRLPISSANVAANLQGYYPAIEAGANTIPVIDNSGALVLASASPAVKAKNGNLLIEGQVLTLATPTASDGDITLNPDGAGNVNLIFEGTKGNQLDAKATNLISGALYSGVVANSATGYYLIRLQSGSSPITRFSVDALGNTNLAGSLQTGSVTRLTSTGQLTAIKGYSQDSGNLLVNQLASDYLSIAKTNVTAATDSATLTLDETGKTQSNYDTLVLNRINGGSDAYALYVKSGNANFGGNVHVNGSLDLGGVLQLGNFSSAPTAMGTGSMIYNTSDNQVYFWNGTAWISVGTASTAPFSGITSGTNTTAAMVVGSGATLDYTGTGTINASSLIGGTWTAPGTIGSGTPNTGAFTTLTSSGNSTIGTGDSTTNTFGAGASSVNTIGSTTTPGALTLHGATTLDNSFTVSGSNLTSLGGNLTVTGTAWTATPTISGLITATLGLTSNGTVTVQNNSNLIQTGSGTFSTGTGAVSLNGDTTITNQGDLKLNEGIAGGTNYVGFQAPATLAIDNLYTLPDAFPGAPAGYYLTSNDTGVMGWSNSVTASAMKWNALTTPDGALSLAHGVNTTSMGWTATGALDPWTFNLINNAGAATTQRFVNIVNAVTSQTVDVNTESLLRLDNADTVTAGLTFVDDAILITNTGGITGGVIDAIDASAAEIVNALNAGPNVILGTTAVIDFTNFDVATTGTVTIATGQSYTGSGTVTLSSAAASALTINSGTTGSIGIGDDGSAETISLGTGAAAKEVTVGSTNTTSSLTLNSGSGVIDIGTTIAKTISIGNTTGATGILERVGTGNYSLDGVAGSIYAFGASTTTGTMTIGGTAQTGTLTLGSSTGTNIVAIGTGTGATTINIAGGATNGKFVNIGTGAVANTITIGTTTASSALALNDDNWNITGGGLANFVSVGAATPGTGAFTTLSATPGSNVTALTLTGTNVTSANLAYFNSKNTSGTIFNTAYGVAATLAGALVGQSINLSTNVTNAAQSVTGISLALSPTTAASTTTLKGLALTSGAVTNSAGTSTWTGLDINMPAITQSAGTLTSTGLKITGGTVTSGTSYGLIVDANAGNVGIGDNTPAATLTVGNGDLFQVAGATGNITTAGTLAVNGDIITSDGNLTLDATSTVIIPDADTFQTNDVTSTGTLSLTSATTNTVTLDSGTTGAVNIGTNANSKTITIGNTSTSTNVVLTKGASGNITLTGFNCSTLTNGGNLTTDSSGNVICSDDDGGAGATNVPWSGLTTPTANLTLSHSAWTTSMNWTATGALNAWSMSLNNNSGSALTQNLVTLTNAATSQTIDLNTESLLKLDNADTSGAGLTVVDNAILITNSGGITNGITDAIDASDTEIVNALNFGTNTILGTTGNIDMTNFDVVGSTGNITTAGALAVNGAGGITSTQSTLIINASGNVDVQDALNADSITSDAGVSIAAGNSYTGAGAVILTSGGANNLSLDTGGLAAINIGSSTNATSVSICNSTNCDLVTIGTNADADTITIGDINDDVSLTDAQWSITGAGAASFVGVNSGSGLLQGTGGLTVTGTVSINDNAATNTTSIGGGTTTGTVTIGGTGTQTLAIGNGAGIKTVNLGSNTTTSATTILSGTTSGVLGLNVSAGGALTNIGTGTTTGTVTLGGTGTQTIAVGDGVGVKTVNLGSSNTTSTTNLLSGSGGINLNASNNQPTNINTGTSTGTVTVGGTGIMAIAIGAGGTGAKTIGIGDGASTGTIAISSGSGGMTLDSTGILELNSSAGVIGIGNDAVAQNINIGTGAAARTITVGNSTTSTSVVLTKGASGNITLTGFNCSTYTSGGTLTTDSSGNITCADDDGATSLSWSALTYPTANLSLAMSAWTTTFNWATGTGANDLFSFTTDASANGTGSLVNIQTGASSTVLPLRVRAGSTEAIIVDSNGNVGIGTVSPVARLDIVGSQNFSAFTAPTALTAGTPTAGGLCTPGTHSYRVTFTSVGAGETTAGTVSGVITCVLTTGQTVPLSAIPTGPAGTISRKIYRTVAGDLGSYLLLTTIADNTTTTFSDTVADASLGAAAPSSNTTAVANLQTGGTTRMVIDNSGNVGIGTTNPSGPLTVGTLNGTSIWAQFNNSDFNGTNAGSGINFRPSASSGDAVPIIQAFKAGVAVQNLSLNPYGGNVGIGTTNPGTLLTIQADNKTGIKIQTSSTNQYTSLKFAESAGAERLALTKETDNRMGFWTATGAAGSEAWTERLSILAGGNVGIGNASPTTALHVGTSSETHALSTGDVLISSDLEIDGVLYIDGGTISNFAGTGTIVFSSTPTTTANSLSASNWLVENTANVGQAALMVNQTKAGDLFTASSSGVTKFKIANNGNVSIDGSGTMLTIGGGTGKIDVGTVDPVYNIGGTKYATYLSGMIGVKEETTGKVTTDEYIPGVGYKHTIDFKAETQGSDLWLFSKATDIKNNIAELVVLLSPSDNTKVWHDINESQYTISIYSTRPTNVSYRFTAPRFDYALWTNYNTSPDSTGFIINNEPLTVTGSGDIKEAQNESLANIQIEEVTTPTGPRLFENLSLPIYQLKDAAGNIINEVAKASGFVAANVKAGAVETKDFVTGSFTAFQATIDNLLITGGLVSPVVQTSLISPLADDGRITITGSVVIEPTNEEESAPLALEVRGSASISGTLYADKIESTTLDDIQKLLRQVETDQNLLAQAQSWEVSTASNSASLDSLAVADLFVTNQAAVNSLSVSNSLAIGSDFIIQSSDFSINTLTSPLKLQSLALAPIEFMAGKVKIETNGDMTVNANLYVAGRVEAQSLAIKTDGQEFASIDASGSATFNSLSTQSLVITAGADATNSAVINGVITTNATAGRAVIPAGVKEIKIQSQKISDYTLVYVTPTSSTENNVLFVKSKEAHSASSGQAGQFAVGFTNPIDKDVSFNWWIVQVTQ